MLLDYEKERSKSALNRVKFNDHTQVHGILSILKLYQYPGFADLMGVARKVTDLKGLDRFFTEYRCRPQIKAIHDYLDSKSLMAYIPNKELQQGVVDIRKEFIEELFEKIEGFIQQQAELFDHEAFEQYSAELSQVSHVLRLKNATDIKEAIQKTGIRHQEEVAEFIIDHRKALRRYCVTQQQTISIMDSHDSFQRLRANFNIFDHNDVVESKFVRDAKAFYPLPGLFSGAAIFFYGLIVASIIAFVLAALSVTGAALAVATFLCSLIFGTYIPYLIDKGVKTVVGWFYDDIVDRHTAQLREFSPEYHGFLNSIGFYKEIKVEEIDDDIVFEEAAPLIH